VRIQLSSSKTKSTGAPSPSVPLALIGRGVSGCRWHPAKGDTFHPRLCFLTSERGGVSSSVCQQEGGWNSLNWGGGGVKKGALPNGIEVRAKGRCSSDVASQEPPGNPGRCPGSTRSALRLHIRVFRTLGAVSTPSLARRLGCGPHPSNPTPICPAFSKDIFQTWWMMEWE